MSNLLQPEAPCFTSKEAADLAQTHFGLTVRAAPLDSYIDQNFKLSDGEGQHYVLKIANAREPRHELEFQTAILTWLEQHAPHLPLPRLIRAQSGAEITAIPGNREQTHALRLFTWLDGSFMADVVHHPESMAELGAFFGRLDRALVSFSHPAANRRFRWHLCQASGVRELMGHIPDPARRTMVQWIIDQFDREVAPKLVNLPWQVIHHDGNDYNILLETGTAPRVTGLIDFGDASLAPRICELAITATYASMGKNDPIATVEQVLLGYQRENPLSREEIALLFPLIEARLAMSVCFSAQARAAQPENAYVSVSEKGAWAAIERLIGMEPEQVARRLLTACGFAEAQGDEKDRLLERRRRHLNPTLSISYKEPLKIVRGFRQYLYDETGRPYLDCVNNVCHVGHSHPHVVAAGTRQMARLNTNTRYLHDHLVTYAERLLATMPDHLSVVTFVCSGSEANDLALRMARTYTGRKDVVVVDAAYHGNTTANIEISPYKFDGKGGPGRHDHIFVADLPCGYYGPHKGHDAAAGRHYAGSVRDQLGLASEHGGAAAFIAESLLGCGGQIVLPDTYLQEAYKHARAAGAVCIADEVQVGFGRVGSHFWGFQTQEVVPDIVTLGKPIGNGHPLAAVITTREIADTFHNGMEYFNTFGGNPVSCAIGMAVLDVIEAEGLQEHARQVGGYLIERLEELGTRHALIGHVRGLGLFIGVELVRDQQTLEPAANEASEIIERMKERGILLSTDGPRHNVLKIKPPIVFDKANADHLTDNLDEVLKQL